MSKKFYVDSDIKVAETLPAEFYRSQAVFEAIKENVFVKTWQFIGDENLVPFTQTVHPFILLDNYITEPLVLSRDDEDSIKCFSNVCTHRGNIVVNNPGKMKQLRCMYHGRRFGLDGTFKSMPEKMTRREILVMVSSARLWTWRLMGKTWQAR